MSDENELTPGQKYKLGLEVGLVISSLFRILADYDEITVDQAIDEWYDHQVAIREPTLRRSA